jgi:hypothetical protein
VLGRSGPVAALAVLGMAQDPFTVASTHYKLEFENASGADARSSGAAPTEYLHIELKTEPVENPAHAVRLRPEPHEANSYARTQFENMQFRIVRLWCVAACPASAHAEDPAVVVAMASREVRWVGARAAFPWDGAGDYVRIEVKGGGSR